MSAVKMTIKERVLFALGYEYLANKRTREIHTMSNPMCHTLGNMSKKNKMYITEKKMLNLIKSGEYNGCRFCLKKHDTG